MQNHTDVDDNLPLPGESFTQEHPETNLKRQDTRWGNHLRDWVILLVMMIVYLSWALLIYFLEPGIR